MQKLEPQLGAGAGRGPSLKVRIPPSARYGKKVRDEVITFANQHDISRAELDEFIFAIGEALANAIEHSKTEDVIEVRCQIEGNKIIATVIDSGQGFEAQPLPGVDLPDEFSERGRGLPIMQKFTDIFAVRSIPGKGTAVVLGRYLRAPSS
ncbi:MAG: anti-sigma F factor [Vulcanimicrobiaceae bacterium]